MIKTIIRRKRSIVATEDTPLTAGELAEFMGWSRATVYRHINKGYRFEYGRTTTPRHYRRWMSRETHKAQEHKVAESQAELQQLERELSVLK